MGHESDCDTLWPAPAGAACMATAPFLTWRWVAFTMHIGMSVNNSTHARIILFLLLRLIILISAKIVNFGVTQCAAATIFSVFLVLCPICNSGKTVCNILPKNSAGATPLWRQSPGAAGAYEGARAARQALACHAIHAALSRRRAKAAAGRHHRHSPDGTRPDGRPE